MAIRKGKYTQESNNTSTNTSNDTPKTETKSTTKKSTTQTTDLVPDTKDAIDQLTKNEEEGKNIEKEDDFANNTQEVAEEITTHKKVKELLDDDSTSEYINLGVTNINQAKEQCVPVKYVDLKRKNLVYTNIKIAF